MKPQRDGAVGLSREMKFMYLDIQTQVFEIASLSAEDVANLAGLPMSC